MIRRTSAFAMAAMVAAIVVSVGLLAPHSMLLYDAVIRFVPDLAVLFAVGVLAAGIVTAGDRIRRQPWGWYSLFAVAPVVLILTVKGASWSNDNLFWVDLAWAPAIGCFLAALGTSRPRPLIRVLDARALRSLGSFSYSLYLTHAPIVIAVSYGLVLGRVAPGTPTFLVLVAILLPVTIGFARVFAALFELPFQRHRGWASLRAAVNAARRPARTCEPAPGRASHARADAT